MKIRYIYGSKSWAEDNFCNLGNNGWSFPPPAIFLPRGVRALGRIPVLDQLILGTRFCSQLGGFALYQMLGRSVLYARERTKRRRPRGWGGGDGLERNVKLDHAPWICAASALFQVEISVTCNCIFFPGLMSITTHG